MNKNKIKFKQMRRNHMMCTYSSISELIDMNRGVSELIDINRGVSELIDMKIKLKLKILIFEFNLI